MSIHGFLERTGLPLLIIVLIPIAAVLYLLFGANENSSAPATSTQTTPTTVQTNAPAATPSASISLDDPSSLSQTVPTGQFIPFSFTIQNTGETGGTIPYRVSVKWSTGEQDVIDENVVTLAGGASTTIDEDLKFEIATETAEVSLELPQTGQSVQFALPRAQ
jgi:hypothetical protein